MVVQECNTSENGASNFLEWIHFSFAIPIVSMNEFSTWSVIWVGLLHIELEGIDLGEAFETVDFTNEKANFYEFS